ncbi:MAG: SHOCT domain-containing protein [Opitutales bacterium]
MPDLTTELTKLAELHKNGVLTNEEFAQAKAKLLSDEPDTPADAESAARNIRPELARPPSRHHRQYPHPPVIHHQIGFNEDRENSFGKAANRFVTVKLILGILGFVLFACFAGPIACSMQDRMNSGPSFRGPGFP